MSEEVSKNWWNSSNRWTYLKIAFLSFTTPSRVYELAHKSHSANIREKVIRGRLIDAGVLGISNSEESSKIDLDKGHIWTLLILNSINIINIDIKWKSHLLRSVWSCLSPWLHLLAPITLAQLIVVRLLKWLNKHSYKQDKFRNNALAYMAEALLFQIKPSWSLGCSYSKSPTERYPICQPSMPLSESSFGTMRYTGITHSV